jgi:uncharacterized protein (TIGR02679 family)
VSDAALDPALRRALLHARDKRERRGGSGDAKVIVADLKPEEALALDGLLSVSRRRPVLPGETLRVALSTFEAALRACGLEPWREYERAGERPLRDLPAERAARLELRSEFRSWLESHEVVRSRPLVAEWLDQACRQGRVHADMRPLVERALRVVGALPATQAVQRTVLAANLLDGDPHALDVGTPLHGLTVSLLEATAKLDPDAGAREVWAVWNVVVDPISSNVAVLNLPVVGEGAAADLVRAIHGTHLVLTYGQLSASNLRWPPGIPCFSCENPSVLIAAERTLGEACPPLVCTGGRPSDAVRLLFSCIHRAGAQIRHHGDFDEAGVQIFRDLEDRYGAVPWRFDIESLRETLGHLGHAVPPAPRTKLENAVQKLSSAVPEELLIEALLSDLTSAGSRHLRLEDDDDGDR